MLLIAGLVVLLSPKQATVAAPPQPQGKLDPAAWGSDHVGQPLPPYTESGECLFCHRDQVGGTWARTSTIARSATPRPASRRLRPCEPIRPPRTWPTRCKLILGDTARQRFLKRAEEYGKVDMLSVRAALGRGGRARLEHAENPHWDAQDVRPVVRRLPHDGRRPQDARLRGALARLLLVPRRRAGRAHANDPKLMPLAKARKDLARRRDFDLRLVPRAVRQESKSSGLPYPNNFVAGDNLFKDFQVDWALADDAKLNPADRHVLDNVRDVVVYGQENMTCLSCHDVHSGSSRKHRDLPDQKYCLQCHVEGKDKKQLLRYEVHSDRCRY